jgi:hypothetical protein
MARSKFEELAIKLDAAPDGRFRATVMSPKAFVGRDVTFGLPDGLVAELDALARYAVGRNTRALGQHGQPGRAAPPDLDRLGVELFDLLFQHSVRDAYNELQRMRKGSNRPQRLRLQISRDASALLRVPWELLKADSSRLALVGSVVRDLQTDLEVTTPRPPPQINVLVVAADPPTLRTLAIDQERQGIEEAFAAGREHKVRVEVVAGEWDALVERLTEAQQTNHRFHVFHYIGHGGTDDDGESFLCFERDGAVDRVPGQRLAELLLSRAPTIRLAFINACHSSAVSVSDAFGGMAQALVGAHIPVTIAMQFAVSDKAATDFSASLYRMLAANQPIEEALLEARRTLERAHPAEWATPTVFMATDSVELFRQARSFDHAKRPTTSSPRLVAPVVTGPSPWAALERARSELAEARRMLTFIELSSGGSARFCADLAAESLRSAHAAAQRAQVVVKAVEPPPTSGSLSGDLRPILLRYLRELCDAGPAISAGVVDAKLQRLEDVLELLPKIVPEPATIAAERTAWELVGCWRAIHQLAAVMDASPRIAGDFAWLLVALVESASSISIGPLPGASADTITDIEQAVSAVQRNIGLGRLDRVLDAAARVIAEALHLAEPTTEALANVA